MTPEQKLSSFWWSVRNSAWVLVPLFGIGLLTWVAFLFIGLQAANRRWLQFAAMWGVILCGYIIGTTIWDIGEDAPDSPGKTILAFVATVNWIAGAVVAFVTNRAWLRSKAYGHTGSARHARTDGVARRAAHSSEAASSAASTSPTRHANEAHPTPPSVPAPPALPLDINIATAAQLQAALGLDQAWGDWLVATRTRLGQFSSVDQLLTVGQVPPHLYVRAKDKLMVRGAVTRPAARARPPLDY